MKDEERKQRPMYTGLFKYFPDALQEVSHVSWKANEQHNPGTPVHWDRSKSKDELGSMLRHAANRAKGEVWDDDGLLHLSKVAWRALAALQKELEQMEAQQRQMDAAWEEAIDLDAALLDNDGVQDEDREIERFYVDDDDALWEPRGAILPHTLEDTLHYRVQTIRYWDDVLTAMRAYNETVDE